VETEAHGREANASEDYLTTQLAVVSTRTRVKLLQNYHKDRMFMTVRVAVVTFWAIFVLLVYWGTGHNGAGSGAALKSNFN
jgi:hypothetical protein